MSEIRHVDRTSDEWDAMWAALGRVVGDMADRDPQSGEVWQYMGTVAGEHQFRHRQRPASAARILGEVHVDRVYINLDARTGDVTGLQSRRYDPANVIDRGPVQ